MAWGTNRDNRNARSKDLDQLLRTVRESRYNSGNEITNGNHRIAREGGAIEPNATMCQPCSQSLYCFLAGKDLDFRQKEKDRTPCYREIKFIRFYYHGTCCLSYDMHKKTVCDHGKWGYSVTTSRSISWYLEALHDNFHDVWLGPDRAQELKKAFKKWKQGDGEVWHFVGRAP